MVELTIDGRKVQAQEGSTVLKAARELGLFIPTLCHHDLLEPYGACRLCLVELVTNRTSKLVTSCTQKVQEGLCVLTQSPRVLEARKVILELIMARCPEVKEIQDLGREMEIERPRFELKEELCTLCGLCARICKEVAGVGAIGFVNRGNEREVTTPFFKPSEECIACGACAHVCPTGLIKVEDAQGRKVIHQELLHGPNSAIRVPFMQAIPNVPYVDKEVCIHFKTENCKLCEQLCEKEAINHDMEEWYEDIEVGSIILATGYDTFDASQMAQYGYGRLDNVIAGLEFERMCHASSSTGGKILLKDGREPERVGIIHCVGSRDRNYHLYCSRVCCMYALKFAHLLKEKTRAEVFDFYIDMRCFGKGYEEFYHRLLEEGVRFVRGKPGEVTDFAIYEGEKGKLIVRCEDTLAGGIRRIPVDMVILCAALEQQKDAQQVAKAFGINLSADGFFREQHPKLGPVSTASDGIYLAGACQGPKDIPDTVAQGAGAAAAALSLGEEVALEPITAEIDEKLCAGCKLCISLCPYDAISYNEEKKVSAVQEELCKGCGTCVAACASGASYQKGFSDEQIAAEIQGALAL